MPTIPGAVAALPADARVLDLPVTARRRSGPDAWILELGLPEAWPRLRPGRFAMLAPADGRGPFIPRPFSIYSQPAPDRLDFLIQVLGPGTRALAALREGETCTATVPLGNGFEVQPPERPVVLVAGGVGSAPFLLYLEERAAAGAAERTWFFYGARSADRLYDRERFEAVGSPVRCSTEDGSLGFAGRVLDDLASALDRGGVPEEARFAACGPEGLLHAFAAFARERGLDAELSLETYMGCGVGVCNACPTPTDPEGPWGDWPWVKTCVDGPVMPLRAIRF